MCAALAGCSGGSSSNDQNGEAAAADGLNICVILNTTGSEYWGYVQAGAEAYRKAGYSRKFREEHEQEILLHQAAQNAFDEMGVKKLPKVKDLQAEYAKLLEEKKKTYAEYRRSREEMRELLTAKANVDRLLKMEQEKDHGQR